jgi:hypothetical protein
MLDLVAAFTYGGRILWSYKPEFSMLGSEREPVNALISNILIEVRDCSRKRPMRTDVAPFCELPRQFQLAHPVQGREAESKEYAHGAYALKWVVDNKNDLICVVCGCGSLTTRMT